MLDFLFKKKEGKVENVIVIEDSTGDYKISKSEFPEETDEMMITKINVALKRIKKIREKMNKIPIISEEERKKNPDKMLIFFERSEHEQHNHYLIEEIKRALSQSNVTQDKISEEVKDLFLEIRK